MKRKAPLVIIFVTLFLDLLGFGMILPILPFYAESFGANAFEIGLLSASFSLMQFLFAPFWGRISDRVGRRPIILMSLMGSSISLLLFGLASNLTMLFIARIFAGIFMANLSAAQAYIADITPPEERAKGMGLVGAAFGLGFIFGPTFGGVLSAKGLSFPAYVASGLALLNFIGAFFLLPESRSKEAINHSRYHKRLSAFDLHQFRKAIFHPLVGLFLVLFFFVTLAFANLEATFALMTERNLHYNAKDNGYLFAYIGVLVAIVQGGLIGPLTRRYGEGKLLTTGLILQAVGFLFLPYLHTLPPMLIMLGLVAVGNGLSTPSLQSLISRNTHEDQQGGVLGVSQSLGSLARVLGPAWGGWFFDWLGVPAPYWSGGILLFLCAGLSYYAVANLQKNLAAQEAAAMSD